MVRVTFAIALVTLGLTVCLGTDAPNKSLRMRGLPELPKTTDSPAKIELGKALFSETKLSADGTVSCASCHDAEKNFATSDPRAIGIGKQVGRRNSPSLLNRAFGTSMFWDGRLTTLEEQALAPLRDPMEMGHSVDKAVAAIARDQNYQERFKAAFGTDEVNETRLAEALAAFQRTLLLGNSPVDAFIDGDLSKITEEAKHGLWLFESKGGCWKCHAGKNYSDETFHNTGVSWGVEPLDLGRFEFTKKPADKGKFKTPSLRGVAKTAPYMHDGSIKTLEEVVAFYSKGGNANPHLDPALKPLNLTPEEQANLVAFLKALSEEVK
jgi:cytochrome c peroxidase